MSYAVLFINLNGESSLIEFDYLIQAYWLD